MKSPVVSIVCITYNHESFIRDCLEGFVMQKTNFAFEVLIHDDASTDKTADIIRLYEAKFPEIIKPIYQIDNQYSKGINPGTEFLFPLARGKYIAICEGDDYWTDPYKLQKQVDFLETNKEYSICSHRYSFYSERTKKFANDTYDNIVFDINGNYYFDQYSYFADWLTQTLTVVFRSDALNYDVFKQFNRKIDFSLFYSITRNSKGCLMNFLGGVYRLHESGVSTAFGNLNHAQWHYEIGVDLFKIENDTFTRSVAKTNTLQYLYSYIKTNDSVNLAFIRKLSKEYASYGFTIKEFGNIHLKIIKAFVLRVIRKDYYKSILKKNY